MLASRAPGAPDFSLSLRLQEATSGKPGSNENARLRPVVETPNFAPSF